MSHFGSRLSAKGNFVLRNLKTRFGRHLSSKNSNTTTSDNSEETLGVEFNTPLSVPLPDSPTASYNSSTAENHATHITVLDNEITVASQPGFGTFCTVGILVNAGSRHEVAYPSGVCHFLERLAFSGSSKFENRDTVMQAVEKLGGICDCQTSRDTTIYAASVSREKLESLMELIGDTVFQPTLPADELQATATNVQFELSEMDSRPDPEPLMTELIHAAAFRGNTVGLAKYPTQQQIPLINENVLNKFLRSYFKPSRMVVAGIGVDHKIFMDLTEKYINEPSKSPSWSLDGEVSTDDSVSQYTGGEMVLQKKFDLTRSVVPLPELAHVSIGLESASVTDPDFVPFAVLNMLMGGGESFSAGGPGKGMFTRLYLNVLNRHHWMYAATAFHHSYSDGGFFCIQASSHPSQIRDSVNVITQEFTRLTDGAPKQELERAKCQLQSMLMMNLESRPVVFEDVGRQVLATGIRKSPQELCEMIQSTTDVDIKRVANRMLSSNVSVAALGDVSKMPSLSDIQTALNRKDGRLPRSFQIFGRR